MILLSQLIEGFESELKELQDFLTEERIARTPWNGTNPKIAVYYAQLAKTARSLHHLIKDLKTLENP